MNELDLIIKCLKGAPEVLLFSHFQPDGDALGSMFALGLALQDQGKKIVMVNRDPIPEIFNYLHELHPVLRPEEVKVWPRVAVGLDCSDLGRVGNGLSQAVSQVDTLINIDHHISNQRFGHLNYVNSQMAATGEIVYKVILALGGIITPRIATALYTSLLTDTGSFRFSNTTSKTHRIVADLIDAGADWLRVNLEIYENKPVVVYRLLGRALETLQFTAGGKAAWMTVTRRMMEELGAKEEHLEGLIGYVRAISGVELGILFREELGKVKVSLRSKNWVDVNALAAQFGGGGHPRAAGCLINDTLENVQDRVIRAVQNTIIEERVGNGDKEKHTPKPHL